MKIILRGGSFDLKEIEVSDDINSIILPKVPDMGEISKNPFKYLPLPPMEQEEYKKTEYTLNDKPIFLYKNLV